MTRPLRSTPITGASPLLRVGPPAEPATVLTPTQSAGYSLSPTRETRTGSVGFGLLPFHAEAADRARVASMPDTAWPISGHPPDLSRDHLDTPVSMSPESFSTRQQRFACARLPDPHLTHELRRFHIAHHGRVTAPAACGGLKPPPQGDSEGPTILHLLHSTASRSSTYIELPSTLGTHPDDDPRLQAQRHHHPVRCAGRADRHDHQPVHASASGMVEIPQDHRPAGAQGPADPPDPGQLRHPQARRRRPVAGQTPPVPPPLHPDLVVVAQPRRTLVPRTYRQSVAAQRLPLRARPRRLYPGIHRRPQRRPQTLRVDR